MHSIDLSELHKARRESILAKARDKYGKTKSSEKDNPTDKNNMLSDQEAHERDIQRLKREAEFAKEQHAIEQQKLADNAQLQEDEQVIRLRHAQKEAEVEAVNSDIQVSQENTKLAEQELAERKADLEKERSDSLHREKELRNNRIWSWVRRLLTLLFALVVLGFLLVVLFRFYRWAVEEPLIKEVEKRVEIPIEKIIETEVEREVEKIVTPEECTQIRRNGRIFMNCDGKVIEGSPTLGESGLTDIPELITEQ